MAIFGAIFWVDASFRAKDRVEEWGDIFQTAIRNKGMVLVKHPYPHWSNYAFTDPVMYKFMPTDVDRQKTVHQVCTCAMLIYNTEVIYKQVLYWMYLCSLEATCCPPIAPIAKQYSHFSKAERRDMTVYKVRRYDQAMANLLLSNLNNYDATRYAGVEDHMKIKRVDMYSNITKC